MAQFFTTQEIEKMLSVPCRCGARMTPVCEMTREDDEEWQRIQRYRCDGCGRTYYIQEVWTRPTFEQVEMNLNA
jgi:transposase-like protein